MKWRKGHNHSTPDVLSRNPVKDLVSEDEAINADVQSFTRRAILRQISFMDCETNASVSPETVTIPNHLNDPLLVKIRPAASVDGDYVALIAAIAAGFPSPRNRTELCVSQFWSLRCDLSVNDGLVLLRRHIVVPKTAHRGVPKTLHAAHQGIVRMKRLACNTIYWQGLSNDIVLLLQFDSHLFQSKFANGEWIGVISLLTTSRVTATPRRQWMA